VTARTTGDWVVAIDLDGTLVDSRVRQHRCYADILTSHGFSTLDIDTYWSRKRARVPNATILAETGADAIYPEFAALWLASIEQPSLLVLDEVIPGSVDTLGRWRAAGSVLALVTLRQSEAGLMSQLRRTGLADRLDLVVRCDPTGRAAGKAADLAAALAARGWSMPSLWVGDTEVDIEAARAIGATAWAVTSGIRNREQLSNAGPDLVAADVASLPSPATLREATS
jgi:phosphoglycolate phosphatase